MKIEVEVYNEVKYNSTSEKVAETIYNNVKSLEVKEITDEEIYRLGFDEVDDYKEYAIITFENGETATFRNSYVDIFRA